MSLFTYLAFGVPTGLVLYVLFMVIMRLTCHPDMSKFKDFDVQRVLKHQGKMQLKELITVIVFFGTVIMWLLPGVAGMFTKAAWVSTLNGYGITFWAILSVVLMSVISINDKPIINLKEVLNGHINWAILIFIAIGVYLGGALSNGATGVNDWITANITPLTSAVSPLMVVIIITAAGECLTNFASNTSTVTVMTGVGVALALASNGAINPVGIALCTTMAGSCAYLLPSSFGCIAMLHGDEWSNSKMIYCYGLLMMIITSIVISLVGYTVGCALVG
jgi:di/tricarboxylate transporter